MAISVTLFSSYEITQDACGRAIVEAGGEITPARPYLGLLSQGESYVWVYWVEDYLEGGSEDEEERALVGRIEENIGGKIKACLSLSISRNRGSQKLAVDFASLCVSKWPCVVEDAEGIEPKIYTKEEIIQLQRVGKGFSDYGL